MEGTLPEGESYSWTFQDGPIVIDIAVASGDNLDAVLQLYDADNNLIAAADSGFTGDGETIIGAYIPDDGLYTIVLKDFFDSGGDFALTVTESSEPPPGDDDETGSADETTVFLFVDDDGDPISTGFTSQTELETLLADNFTVETWVSTVDGPLTLEALETADLLIWDSGDYQNSAGFFDEDTFVIFEYLDTGRPILITGSSPTLFGEMGLSSLSDVEVFGEDEVLLEGFTAGDVLTLNDTYDIVLTDFQVADLEPGSAAFLLQGPESEDSGNIVGLASIDEFNDDQRTILLLFPLSVLSEAAQIQLLTNMLAWLGFSAS